MAALDDADADSDDDAQRAEVGFGTVTGTTTKSQNEIDFPRSEGWVLAANYHSGDSFGELALINEEARSGTARVGAKPAVLVTMKKTDYLSMIAGSLRHEIRQKLDCIGQERVFSQLAPSALRAMAYYFKSRRFRRGETIYRQGDEVDGVYMLRTGECMLDVKVRAPLFRRRYRLFLQLLLQLPLVPPPHALCREEVSASKNFPILLFEH